MILEDITMTQVTSLTLYIFLTSSREISRYFHRNSSICSSAVSICSVTFLVDIFMTQYYR